MQTKLNHTILKLKQDVPTKWNSTYEMIDRFLKNKEPLLSCIAVLGITFDWIAEDWTLMEHAVKLLEFFDTATKNVSLSKSITLSTSVVLSKVLNNLSRSAQVDSDICNDVQNMAKHLVQGIEEKLLKIDSELQEL